MSLRIIKANSNRDSKTIEAFNFVDIERQSRDLLESARREAEDLRERAKNDVASIRQRILTEAREEGLRDAANQIRQQAKTIAEELISEQLTTALPALEGAAAALQAERDRWLVRWEQTAVDLGIAIAEKLLHRQLACRPDFTTDMIAEALRLAAGQPQLTVYLHEEDLRAWGDRGAQIVQSLTGCADATLVADRQMTRGGCRIETRNGEIDARLETMLKRIAEELIAA